MKLFALTLLIALGLASATTPEGKAWLASNLEKEGVKATDSGLQYKIIKSGEDGAPSPLAGTPCACHYRGTLQGDGSCALQRHCDVRILLIR